jgi:hypothetical protein
MEAPATAQAASPCCPPAHPLLQLACTYPPCHGFHANGPPTAPPPPLQLAADLSLHQGDFLNHYQTYLTQLAGFFLVEDAVQATAAGAAGEPLDIVAQVGAGCSCRLLLLRSSAGHPLGVCCLRLWRFMPSRVC